MTAVEKLRCRDSELPDAQIPLVNLHLGLRTEWELKGPGLSSCWPATSFRVQAVVKDLGIQYLGREIQKLPVLRCAVNIERANQTNLVRRSPFWLVRKQRFGWLCVIFWTRLQKQTFGSQISSHKVCHFSY